ncbi:UDP-4-amino-4,6-dideoxy-N-acetyl-beta-L-altrosamine transaminase [Thermodesulfovibrio sp.]|uniref:UDP-4-amino-4, 6-dideoxy-N-acetyl-beta-L-altrosamine transaminase n=1 Tax=Thermodesulfovibrio sp. TaxID=2067987 RepID=UPI003097C1FB
MIPYGRQSIEDDDIQEVIKTLRSDFLTQGPKVQEFEEKLADYCGAKYAVVFNSGTSALYCAYKVLNLKKGSNFITSPITFAATVSAGVLNNLKPSFADVESDTGNMDVNLIENLITEKTRLIVPVHYAGHPVDMEKVWNLAKKYNLYVVEDACHALGSKYKGYKIGSCKFSHMTIFSFHPVKHITTGEGGAVLTNEREFYEKLIQCRNHGIIKGEDWFYSVEYPSFNFRITDIQCTLGISQLRKIDKFVDKRRKIAEIYNIELSNHSLFETPSEKKYAYHSYHLYPLRVKDSYRKKEIFRHLKEKGIGVQVHYIPVYLHSYYRKKGYKPGLCPYAEDFYQREISIPIYPTLNERDLNYVIARLKEIN